MKWLLPLLLLAASAVAQARDERSASVGMRACIEELVLPGSELIAAPAVAGAPIVLRILATRAHGDRFRYDLEWTGLEAGPHDLAKYLARKDGSAAADVPAIPVTVASILPKGQKEPSEQAPTEPPRLAGYRVLQIAAGVLWLLGLLAILFVGKKRRRAAAAPPGKPTLADRLRPLVEAVATGAAGDAQKAELERLLVAFWRDRLGLRDQKAAAAIVAIRQHAEAGQLLRQLEAWLHMPKPPAPVDLQAVLAPYRGVAADRFDPPTAARETA
jgi:hypothetical protein